MRLQLITLQGVSVDTDIYELIAPTTMGDIAVFPDHESLVTMAAPGALAVRYKKDDEDTELDHFAISGGVIEINNDTNSIKVLVDEADFGDDILEAESQAALERAMKLRDEATDQIDIEKAHEIIQRQRVRLKVAELQKRRKRQG